MPPSLAGTLSDAARATRAAALGADADPLRLELPPSDTGSDRLEPRVAAVLGALYLLSELEQCQVVAAAELLANERWNLGVRDEAASGALEAYAGATPRWPRPTTRQQLYTRLFGAVPVDPPPETSPLGALSASANDALEELLAGYCQVLADFPPVASSRSVVALHLTGNRLRANLAPRQFGNTLIIADLLVTQLRAALDLLAMPGIGALFATTGTWNVLRALLGEAGSDIGRHLDRGSGGRVVVASLGATTVPELVDPSIVDGAVRWLMATGFTLDGVAR